MAEIRLRWGRWGLGGHWAGSRLLPRQQPPLGSGPVLARVQEQLTSRWEGNQGLATRARDRLAQHEADLMDLRGALNRAVGTTREAEELNSRNQERLEDALVRDPPLLLPSPAHPPALWPLVPTLSHLCSCYPPFFPVASSTGSRSCPGTMPL